jgi:hypothetical protein
LTEKLAIWTLGLEEDIWADISASEKSLYKRVGYCYVALTLLACTASFTLMWLITSSIAATIPSGAMLSFIVANIIRFSLITVRRSLYNETAESVITPPPPGNTRLKLIYMLKKLWLTLKPDFSAVIRTGVMLVMLQLIVFPNTILMMWQSVSADNEAKRAELVEVFTNRNVQSIKKEIDKNSRQLLLINEAIDTLSENPGEVNLLLLKKREERQLLLTENHKLTRKLDSVTTVWAPMYSATIEKAYFPVMTFAKAGKTSLFLFMEAILLCLMFYPFRQLRRLKKGGQFIYSQNSTEYYREKVLQDYRQHLITIQKSLDKYGVNSEYHGIWSDPPFCTTYKQTVTPKKILPLASLLQTENQTPA